MEIWHSGQRSGCDPSLTHEFLCITRKTQNLILNSPCVFVVLVLLQWLLVKVETKGYRFVISASLACRILRVPSFSTIMVAFHNRKVRMACGHDCCILQTKQDPCFCRWQYEVKPKWTVNVNTPTLQIRISNSKSGFTNAGSLTEVVAKARQFLQTLMFLMLPLRK